MHQQAAAPFVVELNRHFHHPTLLILFSIEYKFVPSPELISSQLMITLVKEHFDRILENLYL